jgi:hypothetical protein
MFDPIAALSSKIAEIKAEVRRDVHVDILREAVLTGLSRLATLDPDRPERYLAAVKDIS